MSIHTVADMKLMKLMCILTICSIQRRNQIPENLYTLPSIPLVGDNPLCWLRLMFDNLTTSYAVHIEVKCRIYRRQGIPHDAAYCTCVEGSITKDSQLTVSDSKFHEGRLHPRLQNTYSPQEVPLYALTNRFEVRYVKNSSVRVTVFCIKALR
jgi:hypothetical protein